MTSEPLKFLVFESKTGPMNGDEEMVYSASNFADVRWPPSVRRGRPKKDRSADNDRHERSLVKKEMCLKPKYEFVECSNDARSNGPKTRKLVRSHVMRNFRQRKQSLQRNELDIEGQDQYRRTARFEDHFDNQPPERWSWDPFNSFPMEMQPHMQNLLYLCKLIRSMSTRGFVCNRLLKRSCQMLLLRPRICTQSKRAGDSTRPKNSGCL